MIEWLDEETFRLGGAVFRLDTVGTDGDSELPFDFLILKLPSHLARYLALVDEFKGARIFELGVKHGGSTAMFGELLQPEKMVAIDISPDRLTNLDEFLTRRQLSDRVLPFYGVDQADSAMLTSLVNEHMSGPLDLVIDDASHYPAETRVTFNTMFPLLRPGGVFILEDWSAAMAMERAVAKLDPDKLAAMLADAPRDTPVASRPQAGFAKLVLELVLVSGSEPDIVGDVTVSRGVAIVRRGDAEINPDGFNISDHYSGVGRAALGEAEGSAPTQSDQRLRSGSLPSQLTDASCTMS